jgi:hypothetical protein
MRHCEAVFTSKLATLWAPFLTSTQLTFVPALDWLSTMQKKTLVLGTGMTLASLCTAAWSFLWFTFAQMAALAVA